MLFLSEREPAKLFKTPPHNGFFIKSKLFFFLQRSLSNLLFNSKSNFFYHQLIFKSSSWPNYSKDSLVCYVFSKMWVNHFGGEHNAIHTLSKCPELDDESIGTTFSSSTGLYLYSKLFCIFFLLVVCNLNTFNFTFFKHFFNQQTGAIM